MSILCFTTRMALRLPGSLFVCIFARPNGKVVRHIGLEPTRLASPDPKSGAATNYANAANCVAKVQQLSNLCK